MFHFCIHHYLKFYSFSFEITEKTEVSENLCGSSILQARTKQPCPSEDSNPGPLRHARMFILLLHALPVGVSIPFVPKSEKLL